MFQLELTPKQLFHFNGDNENIQIPSEWKNFAALSDINSSGGIIKFIPYDYQLKIQKLMDSHSCVIVKGRQLGISETVLSVILHRACLNRGYTALVFSKTQVDSSLLAMRAKRALESIGVKMETDNLRDLIIRNGGRVRFLNSKPESSRGSESISDIIYDEASYLDELKSIRDAATPTQAMLGDKAREYFISTPSGSSGLFYELAATGNSEELSDICKRVVDEKLGFYSFIDDAGWGKVFVNHSAHPIYSQNPNYLSDMHTKKHVALDVIQREHNLSFEDSEGHFFTNISLERCWDSHIKEDCSDSESIYVGGLDTNNLGSDFWCFSVWRYDDNKRIFYKVAGYRRNKGTFIEHCNQTIYLIKKFPNLVLGVEKNGLGGVAFEEIKHRLSGLTCHLISVTGENKGGLIQRVKAMIEAEKIRFEKSDPLQKDLEFYRQIGEQYRAATNCNDDEVSALAVMLQAASNEDLLGAF